MSNEPEYLHGLHDPGYEHWMGDKPGWIVFTHALGIGGDTGYDYSQWADQGYGVTARLNYGYGSGGTIPTPDRYDAYATRVIKWMEASKGCHLYILGNEMNVEWERPGGQTIYPWQYAMLYAKVWRLMQTHFPNETRPKLLTGAIGPWNDATSYDGNERGDWVTYFTDMLGAIKAQDAEVDGIALHTYTHGPEPEKVRWSYPMDPPFQDREFEFRCYRDFLGALPDDLRDVPVYITECNQDGWAAADTGWMKAVFQEISGWYSPTIRALCFYCCDRRGGQEKYHLPSFPAQVEAFKRVAQYGYTWEDEPEDEPGCVCPHCGGTLQVVAG